MPQYYDTDKESNHNSDEKWAFLLVHSKNKNFTVYINLGGWKVNKASKRQEAGRKQLVTNLVYFSILKMEILPSSETLVNHHTTWRHLLGYDTSDIHWRETLKSQETYTLHAFYKIVRNCVQSEHYAPITGPVHF
jgi:hypothetical protein